MSRTSHLQGIDALRGLAAFFVMWFHFTNATSLFPSESLVALSGKYGWLGVQMFFVISGYVIMLSLHRGQYIFTDYGRFIVKRIIRLHPPYLASIVIALVVAWLASQHTSYQGELISVSVFNLVCHFFYLAPMYDEPWIIGVYWTLAIELQYYIAIGILYPLLIGRISLRWLIVTGTIVVALTFPDARFLAHHACLFILGGVVMCRHSKVVTGTEFGCLIVILLPALFLSVGLPATIAGAGTAFLLWGFGIIATPIPTPIVWLGAVSYSLYLVHAPIGTRFIRYGARFASDSISRYVVLLVAISVSLLISYLLYLSVEKPSQMWSSRIRYDHSAAKKRRYNSTDSSGRL